MYLLHRKKIDIYANISLFLSYSEVTVATRSSPYPAEMITAVTRSSPDQMVDQHLEMTSTALNVSGDQTTTVFSGQRGTGPLTEPGFSQGFFLCPVTDGVVIPCRCRLWLA